MQRSGIARFLAQRAMELVLQNDGQKISRVRNVAGNVILCAGIEVRFTARLRRRDALIFSAQFPPRFVVIGRLDFAGEDLPAPLVQRQREGQECDFVERSAQLQRNIGFGRWLRVCEPECLQIRRRDGKRDRIANRFVKAVIRAAGAAQ